MRINIQCDNISSKTCIQSQTCHAKPTDYRTEIRPTTTIKTTAHAELEQPEKVDGLKQPSPSFSFYIIVFDFPRPVHAHRRAGRVHRQRDPGRSRHPIESALGASGVDPASRPDQDAPVRYGCHPSSFSAADRHRSAPLARTARRRAIEDRPR